MTFEEVPNKQLQVKMGNNLEKEPGAPNSSHNAAAAESMATMPTPLTKKEILGMSYEQYKVADLDVQQQFNLINHLRDEVGKDEGDAAGDPTLADAAKVLDLAVFGMCKMKHVDPKRVKEMLDNTFKKAYPLYVEEKKSLNVGTQTVDYSASGAMENTPEVIVMNASTQTNVETATKTEVQETATQTDTHIISTQTDLAEKSSQTQTNAEDKSTQMDIDEEPMQAEVKKKATKATKTEVKKKATKAEVQKKATDTDVKDTATKEPGKKKPTPAGQVQKKTSADAAQGRATRSQIQKDPASTREKKPVAKEIQKNTGDRTEPPKVTRAKTAAVQKELSAEVTTAANTTENADTRKETALAKETKTGAQATAEPAKKVGQAQPSAAQETAAAPERPRGPRIRIVTRSYPPRTGLNMTYADKQAARIRAEAREAAALEKRAEAEREAAKEAQAAQAAKKKASLEEEDKTESTKRAKRGRDESSSDEDSPKKRARVDAAEPVRQTRSRNTQQRVTQKLIKKFVIE
jgi:hypothetical protein